MSVRNQAAQLRKDEPRDKLVDQNPALLLVSADVCVVTLCQDVANRLNCDLAIASDASEAEAACAGQQVAVALLDADTIPQYLDLVRQIKEKSARIEVVIAQSAATIAEAVNAVKAGASDYIEKTSNAGVLEQIISRALRSYAAFQPSVLPLEEVIKEAITHAIAQAEGDKVRAAHLLAIGKTTLYRKLSEYGQHTERKTRCSSKKGKATGTNKAG